MIEIHEKPDRPVGRAAAAVRFWVRRLRLLKHKILLGRKFEHGSDLALGGNVKLLIPEFARFGDRVHTGRNWHVETNLIVGNDVLISSNVAIVGNDHRFDDPARTVYCQGRYPASCVELGGDNLIGFGVIIIGNVRIGKGCIVGAGAVVTRDLPEYTICVGVPARAIRHRFEASGQH